MPQRIRTKGARMKLCKNKGCTLGGFIRGPEGERAPARPRGAYCSDTCASYVRIRRQYARRKAGVELERCQPCKGTGFVAKEKP